MPVNRLLIRASKP